MSDESMVLVLALSILGAVALPFVILACSWPILRKTRIAGKIAGPKKRPHRWRTRKMLFFTFRNTGFALLSPLAACWEGIKRLGNLLDRLSKQKPADLAPVLVWIVVTALLFKPLFGNPFSQAGWSNAFGDPAGLIVFTVIALVSLLLIVSVNRSGDFCISPELKRVALRSTIALLIFGGIAYFLFFAVQAQTHTSNKENEVHIQQNTSSTQHAFPQPTPFSSAQHGNAIDSSASAFSFVPSAPLVATAKLTGTEEFGVKLFNLEPGQSARITYESGEICALNKLLDNCDPLALWGTKNTDMANYKYNDGGAPVWQEVFRYSSVPDVKAREVIAVLGHIGGGGEIIFQFLEGQNKLTLTNSTDETKPLYIYLHTMTEFWGDSSQYIFPSKVIANSFGHSNVQYQKGFRSRYHRGSMSFSAEILN